MRTLNQNSLRIGCKRTAVGTVNEQFGIDNQILVKRRLLALGYRTATAKNTVKRSNVTDLHIIRSLTLFRIRITSSFDRGHKLCLGAQDGTTIRFPEGLFISQKRCKKQQIICMEGATASAATIKLHF